ncbi:hypothetical protein Rt10032_c19g6182 [Rhodotorula toruloides]|uniref:Uncharacterized protein n=1 Tax=Rhodotorula toruloides TaxID=5286 RepID=A0A511KQH1_RHOTO|nr:hypothetical protein Rt10032_c19g6182 [Rhodotorula toruloides]
MFSARSLFHSSLGQLVVAQVSQALEFAAATILFSASGLVTCTSSASVAETATSKSRSNFFEPTRAKAAAPALSLVAPLAVSTTSPRDSLGTLDTPVTLVETADEKALAVDVAAFAVSLDIAEPPSPTLSCVSSISSAPPSPIFDSDASFTSQQVEEVQRSDAYWIKREALGDILAAADEEFAQKGLLRGISLADIQEYGVVFIEQEESYELALETSRRNNGKFEEDDIEREERLGCRLEDRIYGWLVRQLYSLDDLPAIDPTRPAAQTTSRSRLARVDSTDEVVDMRTLRARLSLPPPAREELEHFARKCHPDTLDLRRELAKQSCNIAEYKAQQRAQRMFVERARLVRKPAKRAMPIAQRRVPSSAPRFE